MDVFDDLVAEQDELERVLSELPEQVWLSTSGAAGWTIADVVLHLAQTEEAVVATAQPGTRASSSSRGSPARSAHPAGPRIVSQFASAFPPQDQICSRTADGRCTGVRSVLSRRDEGVLGWSC
jgi:hypothetical protein